MDGDHTCVALGNAGRHRLLPKCSTILNTGSNISKADGFLPQTLRALDKVSKQSQLVIQYAPKRSCGFREYTYSGDKFQVHIQ